MEKPNQLSRAFAAMQRLPTSLRRVAMTKVFTINVKFAGTGGVRIEEAGDGRVVMTMKNRRRVQNHIGGIHAAGMALLAESATGVAFGMSVPDTHLPLLKSMKVNYVRRAQGDLRAEAQLPLEKRAEMSRLEKGDSLVPVKVTDAAGNEPIECELVWAWVPKKR
jgi:uncharacterized protein (TIGR00369 family)